VKRLSSVRCSAFALFAFVSFAILPTADAVNTYIVIDLGTLGGHGTDGDAGLGINDLGQVTGLSTLALGNFHAFLYSDGTMFDLGTLSVNQTDNSNGHGINNSGVVTGGSDTTDGIGHGFLYSGRMEDLNDLASGHMADFDFLGGGTAINDSGQVTGIGHIHATGGYHAFLYSGGISSGSAIDLGTLGGGGDYSVGSAINNSAEVTGDSYAPAGDHAFLYSGGLMTDLGTLGGPYSNGQGINNYGEVTGVSETTTGTQHAFLYSGGVMTDLGTLGGPTKCWFRHQRLWTSDGRIR
jgi:probable HAF family extracellular repeat protein